MLMVIGNKKVDFVVHTSSSVNNANAVTALQSEAGLQGFRQKKRR